MSTLIKTHEVLVDGRPHVECYGLADAQDYIRLASNIGRTGMMTRRKPAPARDPAIWRELAPLEDGFVPAVKRVYTYTGPAAIGLENCNMPIELIAAHPSVPGLYRATAIFAFNVCHCPDYVRLEHCTPSDD